VLVELSEGPNQNDVVVAGRSENLVLEFDEAYTAFVEGFEVLPTEAQLVALQAVDSKLAAMVGEKDATLWSERSRRQDPVWQDVRRLASAAIHAFDWPLQAQRED
jgi:hypothetical protein